MSTDPFSTTRAYQQWASRYQPTEWPMTPETYARLMAQDRLDPFEEIDPNGYLGEALCFEDTSCTNPECEGNHAVGPHVGEDEDGYPSSAWGICFAGPLGPICEDCAQLLDPTNWEA